MAWGTIPVVSDLACFKDFVTDGHNGFIFDHRSPTPATACAAAIENAMQAGMINLGQRSMLVRKTHGIQTIAKAFLDDFESLLGIN